MAQMVVTYAVRGTVDVDGGLGLIRTAQAGEWPQQFSVFSVLSEAESGATSETWIASFKFREDAERFVALVRQGQLVQGTVR
jgi:hypothetical protein